MKLIKLSGHLLLILTLTAFTQIGGLIYLVFTFVDPFSKAKRRIHFVLRIFLFIGLYLFFAQVITPFVAKSFGRVALPITNSKLKPATHATWLANRHYVKEELYELLQETGDQLPEGMSLVYLDACFPFIDGFPLVGHLSHNDGEKIDLAFIYSNDKGDYLNDGKSLTGYGVVEPPLSGEVDQPKICDQQGYWQYALTSNFALYERFPSFQFDLKANKLLLKKLAGHEKTGKIFIEPHLKTRLGLSRNDKIRFHGCHAARHDDHIHLQL